MNDRDLLELAAKAAEIELWHEDVFKNGLTRKVSQAGILCWNPLIDDGDALRLFTTLPFRQMYVSEIGVTVSWRRDDSIHGVKCDEYVSEHGGDLNAATRRAIVRAAAEIGRIGP